MKKKIKLYRYGKLAGLITANFYDPLEENVELFWQNLGVEPLRIGESLLF